MGVMETPGPSKGAGMASSSGGHHAAGGSELSSAALRLSCAECRRRKLKCDRKIPCNMCIKRGCDSLCPDGVLPPKNAIKGSAYGTLQNRVTALEALLTANNIAIPNELRTKGKEKEGPRTALRGSSRGGAGAGTSSDEDDDERPRKTGGKDEGEDDDWIPSFGTLELGKAGRARFVGATAGSLWLSNEHMHSATPAHERQTPAASGSFLSFLPSSLKANTRQGPATYAQLRARLPPRADALYLINLYYMEYSWLHTVVSQSSLLSHFEAFYSTDRHLPPSLVTDEWTSETHPHKMALLFVAMAMGAYYDPQQSTGPTLDEGKAQAYHALCVEALELSSNDPTVASLQTLHIMANYHLSIDRIKGGDVVWSLWGLLMRQAVAMGMHRDGQRWNLPPLICDERRRVWWEIFTEDSFQSNCFGRPGGMTPKHFDTAFPEEVDAVAPTAGDDPAVGYSISKFRMGRLANEVLDHVMCITPPSYAEVNRLSKKITTFEKSIPFFLRCRPALLATTSAYATPDAAIRASPETKVADMRLTFQQHTLSLNASEAQFFLLRPFFARALHENPADPSKSRYGESYLCVAERCSIMITILMSVQSLYPTSTPRQWFFWYHAASAAVCMASLVISAPQSPLALFGWMNLQSVCNLFSSVATQAKSTMTSLTLLLKLREKASDALSGRQAPFFKAPSPVPRGSIDQGHGEGSDDEGDSSNLIGLHTRLIERGNQGMARSRVFKGNVRSPSPRQQVGHSTGALEPARPTRTQSNGSDASHMKIEVADVTLADFIDANPFVSQQQQQQQRQRPQSQPAQPPPQAEEFLYSYSQMQPPPLPSDMEAVDEPDSHTAGILNSLWAPQGDDWSTANQQVDWEGLSLTLGINFLASGQSQPALPQQHQQPQQQAAWTPPGSASQQG